MKGILFTILLLATSINILIGQTLNGQSYTKIKQANVKKIETYFFESDQTADSLLITLEEFNKEGWREKIEIHDSTGLRTTYEYVYFKDSIMTERRTYFKGVLKYVTKIENDKFGNQVATVDYDANGNKTGLKSKTKYNKQHQEIESKTCQGRKVIYHVKRKYYKNGNLKEIKSIKPKQMKGTLKFDEGGEITQNVKINEGNKREVFENYNSSGKKMIQLEEIIKRKTMEISVKGAIKVDRGDILKTETYFRKDHLFDYKIQHLNGVLIGTKKYKYMSFN